MRVWADNGRKPLWTGFEVMGAKLRLPEIV